MSKSETDKDILKHLTFQSGTIEDRLRVATLRGLNTTSIFTRAKRVSGLCIRFGLSDTNADRPGK